MSSSPAIAAVTMTLQSILQSSFDADDALPNTKVTILPLDKARDASATGHQLNLFLYMMSRNAAWVNADMPRQVKPGELAISPLPLNLYFLITAFADDEKQAFTHEVMGRAMSTLYDHPVLSAKEIADATKAGPENDLAQQIERVRITYHPLNIDELSKLWTGFAMQYRLSAAYEVGVVLIESMRAAKTPLPVLARGPNDAGFAAQGDLTPPLPTLFTVTPPHAQPAARLSDTLSLTGVHLEGTVVKVRFAHRLWDAPIERVPEPGATDTMLTVKIPGGDAATWHAGFYTVDVAVQRTGEAFTRTTNQLTVALAPSITKITPLSSVKGKIDYTVSVEPDVVLGKQRAALMIGDGEFLPDAKLSSATSLTFHADVPAAGPYFVRLRVDGVDSLLVDRTKTPPEFDTKQQVTVMP